jgi:hypothetical protein
VHLTTVTTLVVSVFHATAIVVKPGLKQSRPRSISVSIPENDTLFVSDVAEIVKALMFGPRPDAAIALYRVRVPSDPTLPLEMDAAPLDPDLPWSIEYTPVAAKRITFGMK